MRNAIPSDELLANALEMTSKPIYFCQIAPGHVEWYAPCGSGQHARHVVTLRGDRISCDCAAYGLCKHILSSIGRPVLGFLQQCRWCQDEEWLDAVVALYAPVIRELPECLKMIARAEIRAARERLGMPLAA